jgi:hypothetical protein
MGAILRATPAIVTVALFVLALPVRATAQGNRCETARELMQSTRLRLPPDPGPPALREAMENLRRATELCPGLADSYYFLSLVATALKDQARAENWRTRAQFYGSTALERGEALRPSATGEVVSPAVSGAPPAASSSVLVAPVAVSPIVQRKLAVVVGISRFRDSRINALKYTSKDAEAIARSLKEDCAFDYVKLLLDEEATTYNLKTEIDRVARMADPNDLVVLYVSSHGSPENLDVAGINYIVTHDTEVSNLYPTAYRMDDLLDDIGLRLKAERVVAFLDTCYSGGTFRELPATWTTGSRSLLQGGAPVGRLQERLTRGARNLVVASETGTPAPTARIRQGVGRVVITSSSQAERSWESDEIKHGYFTYYLLEALRKPGTLSVDQLFSELRVKVPEAVLRDKNQTQHPGIARSRDVVSVYLKDLPVSARQEPR